MPVKLFHIAILFLWLYESIHDKKIYFQAGKDQKSARIDHPDNGLIDRSSRLWYPRFARKHMS